MDNSDGQLIWKKTSITYAKKTLDSERKIPNNYREIPLPYNNSKLYKLSSSQTAGDGTVPIESLHAICNTSGIKDLLQTGVEHQSAYSIDNFADLDSKPAVQFTLRAIIKMVQGV
jgi:hypothetical protein